MTSSTISRAAPPASVEQATRVAVVGALSATTMLFASLVSAYWVRRSFADWRPSSTPWAFVLLAFAVLASTGIEIASRTAGVSRRRGLTTLVLSSGLYLVGALAVIASATLDGAGVASPYNAFVALLLSLHVVHALVGATASTWVLLSADGDQGENSLALARLITHFLAALLLAILFLLCVLQ